jgi:hypothetical protein
VIDAAPPCIFPFKSTFSVYCHKSVIESALADSARWRFCDRDVGHRTVRHLPRSVALLLWGVRMVRTGMTRAFGAALRERSRPTQRTRIGAFFAAIGVTGILQSSTATDACCSPRSRDAA